MRARSRLHAGGAACPPHRVLPASLHYLILGAAGLIFSQAPECKYITGVDPADPEFAEQHAAALITVLTAGYRGMRSTPPQRRSASTPSRRRRGRR
jgi:hypothetical protein